MLDVGTASGFFAFECARRGGSVTAIDVHDGNLFRDLRDGLGLEVDYVRMYLFDLESGFGEFDLVVCGSVLLHISDIFGAVRKMHSVCRGETLIATAVMDDIEINGEVKPWCEFLGWRAEGGAGEYWTVWMPSMSGLASMCTAAGYSRVEQQARFTLCSVPGMNDYATPHGVVRAQI